MASQSFHTLPRIDIPELGPVDTPSFSKASNTVLNGKMFSSPNGCGFGGAAKLRLAQLQQHLGVALGQEGALAAGHHVEIHDVEP